MPNDASTAPFKGGRGRGGSDNSRGSRGRGGDRGRGAPRGARGGSAAPGSRAPKVDKTPPAPTTDSTWDTGPIKSEEAVGGWDQPTSDSNTLDSSWEHVQPADAIPTPEAPKPSSKPDGTRSWASLMKPKPPTVPQVSKPTPSQEPPEQPVSATTAADMQGLPPPAPVDVAAETANTPPLSAVGSSEPTLEITPSKDELTETNVEQITDTSAGPVSMTAASTVASNDVRSAVDSGTPLLPSHQPTLRPPMGGYATSAYKATGMPGRSASFQRKILEQQEAVVMPNNHAVDRAAVQFGSMGLNGTADDGDAESDREEAETRAQPPQHSPVAPRASLPPVPQQEVVPSQIPVAEPQPTPRQAPGLPPVNQQQAFPPKPTAEHSSQQGFYSQFGTRYAAQTPQEPAQPTQKPYEPFGSQIQPSQHQFDGYPTASQAPSHAPGLSSAPNDSSAYNTSDNPRYQNYFHNYAQPQQSNQEGGSQQRAGSAFGASMAEPMPSYAAAQAQHQQGRYGQAADAQNSGHSTPNPSLPGQLVNPQQSHLMQQQSQAQGGGQHGFSHGGYPYYGGSPYYAQYMNQDSNPRYGGGRPMFDDARRYDDQYMQHNAHFGYGGQSGYGGGPFGGAGGKQGMYGQLHQAFGQTGYDQHSASPANVGGFGQQHTAPSRDATSSNLGAYGRTGSAQPNEGQSQFSGAGGYGNISETYSRSQQQSGYPSQSAGLGHQQSSGAEDSVRPFSDASKAPGTGPSPALGQRPGSTANQGQSNMPPQPNQHGQGGQAYGAYPGQMGQQSSQYGAGQHQAAGQSQAAGGYGGGYGGGGGFGGGYYGSGGRGNWGNYGGH